MSEYTKFFFTLVPWRLRIDPGTGDPCVRFRGSGDEGTYLHTGTLIQDRSSCILLLNSS